MDKFSRNSFPSNSSILLKKFSTPISSNISKGPLAQLKPNLIASSMSLKSFVMPGTNEDEYFIILEITDQAYSPNLSSLEIKDFKSTLSDPIFIF